MIEFRKHRSTMRTLFLSRISSLGVRFGLRSSRRHLTGGLALLCVMAVGIGAPRIQNGPDDTKQVGKPGSATANEPVAIESRASTASPKPADSRPVDIRVNKTLVLINVTVTDPLNRFVTGLEKEHFRLFEDKIEQEITQFSSEDAPISIGLVFDTSGSMGAKLQKSRQAAAEFFKTANPADEFFLVQFNDRPELTVPFTTDTDKIQSTLTFTQSRGRTALLDSVYLAMHEMKKAHNPR
jgi:Ca-activated chloride channel family protein